MARIKDVLSIMREFAPESATDPDFEDSVGLMIGDEEGDTEVVLLCLDCTASVIGEAEKLGAKLVISHHPAIFRGIKTVTTADKTGRTVLAAAKAGVTVYSAHTNLDFCTDGINDYNATLMQMTDVRPMQVQNGVGVGRYGKIKPTTLADFTKFLRETFDDRYASFVGTGAEKISKVAVVNGGGGSLDLMELAKSVGADCYVTADVPHHVLLEAYEGKFPIIAMQHYNMERIYLPKLVEILTDLATKRGIKVKFKTSIQECNPTKQEVI